jgi:hypothetical protein
MKPVCGGGAGSPPRPGGGVEGPEDVPDDGSSGDDGRYGEDDDGDDGDELEGGEEEGPGEPG